MTDINLHIRDYRLGGVDESGNIVWPPVDFEHNAIWRANASTLTVAHPDGEYHFVVIPAGKDTGDFEIVWEGAPEAEYVTGVDFGTGESITVGDVTATPESDDSDGSVSDALAEEIAAQFYGDEPPAAQEPESESPKKSKRNK